MIRLLKKLKVVEGENDGIGQRWLVLFVCPKTEEVLLLYPVSEAFLQAVRENTRRFFRTGRITTKAGAVHVFGNEDIVKGSGYISSQ